MRMDTTVTTHTPARHMATTGLNTSSAASLSAPDPGTTATTDRATTGVRTITVIATTAGGDMGTEAGIMVTEEDSEAATTGTGTMAVFTVIADFLRKGQGTMRAGAMLQPLSF